ncbi:MAG: hypothetical protein AB7E84_06010 [Xanthobacteraceae bacterium]
MLAAAGIGEGAIFARCGRAIVNTEAPRRAAPVRKAGPQRMPGIFRGIEPEPPGVVFEDNGHAFGAQRAIQHAPGATSAGTRL